MSRYYEMTGTQPNQFSNDKFKIKKGTKQNYSTNPFVEETQTDFDAYKNTTYFKEFMKSKDAPSNFNSKSDIRTYVKWVEKNKGIDINASFSGGQQTPSEPSKKNGDGGGDFSDYQGSESQKANAKLIKQLEKREPKELLIPGAKKKGKFTTEQANRQYIKANYGPNSNLPDRPKAPQMPKIKLPGGVSRQKVAAPSGRTKKNGNPKKIYEYKASGDNIYDKRKWNPKNTIGSYNSAANVMSRSTTNSVNRLGRSLDRFNSSVSNPKPAIKNLNNFVNSLK